MNVWNDYQDDPELGDESDPAYKEVIFQTMKYMMLDPAKLVDPAYRAEYIEWLKTQ